MHTLITGGAGFIGSNLVAHHLNKGDSVAVIDDLSTGNIENIKGFLDNPQFSFHQQDLVTWNGLSDALQNADRVYHFAAIVGMFHVLECPVETLNVNINGTLRLFETIYKLGIKPLTLVASSSEVYGDQHRELKETSHITMEGSQTSHAAYAISKLSQESIALAFWHKHQLPCIVLRLFNTVGKNQLSRYGMVIPRFIKQALHHENITIFGDGTQKRAFCDVRDSVNLITLLANNPASIGEIVNVGNDVEISINDLAKLIKKVTASQSSLTYTPFEVAYHNDYMKITERKPSIEKLIGLTNYTYQWNIEKTIEDIVESKK